MTPEWNENIYTQQFDGDLRGNQESIPAHVTTNLRMMTGETAREIRKYRHHSNSVPQYVFEHGEDLPMHPSLRALGRHYFTW
jgi:hypothetical protein